MEFIDRQWDAALPTLMDYIAVPARSPMFDVDWETTGHIATAARMLADWARRQPIDGMTVEDFPAFAREHWPRIATAIRNGNYRAKSRAAPLKTCEFLGFRLNNRAKLAWTEKAHHRFKERIREITRRNRGHNVQTVIDELNLYIRGWLNYYKLSSTYKEVLALSVWVRRRVRL